ncbi:DUF2269 family protein [Caenimonas koreensis DSM 17982]|uniref:DUF2269 family protein n=1 Tax=Caenimonas koreensis DSM 17982 TaxID=1121255 RepID=A0A844BAL4_9BURK|nr:DUF2269 domain-containing protein [Caenimonas koreensis]MRD47571.1 DUF2269 family protein [Caenimonas koreensis DSM 17982]
MNTYLVLKWLHVVSSTVLFGTGIGIAFFKWMADRAGDVHVIRVVNERTVLADWMFTLPAVVLQPVTGLAMAWVAGYPLASGWLLVSQGLYLVAGGCWLPVVWLQLRMRDLARAADDGNSPLPAQYRAYARAWFWLGVPAFCSLIAVFGLMVFKPTW